MKKSIDWEKVELEYRAGQMTLMQIADRNGCSESGVRKRAKKCGWVRNLKLSVIRETNNKLFLLNAAKDATDTEVIDHAVSINVTVIQSHRDVIEKGRELTIQLLNDLTNDMNTEKTLRCINPKVKINTDGNAKTLGSIANSMKTFIALERQNYRLDDTSDDTSDNAPSDMCSDLVRSLLDNPDKHIE